MKSARHKVLHTIAGKPMLSVPGGGHWGGGIVISARDLSLMGRLVANGGAWDGKHTTTTVGYDHNLSKRTDVYGVVMNDRFTGLKSGTSLAVGIRHRF